MACVQSIHYCHDDGWVSWSLYADDEAQLKYDDHQASDGSCNLYTYWSDNFVFVFIHYCHRPMFLWFDRRLISCKLTSFFSYFFRNQLRTWCLHSLLLWYSSVNSFLSIRIVAKWAARSSWHRYRNSTKEKPFSSLAAVVLWERWFRFRRKHVRIKSKFNFFSIAGFGGEIAVLMFRIERNFDFGSTEEGQNTRRTYRRYVQDTGKCTHRHIKNELKCHQRRNELHAQHAVWQWKLISTILCVGLRLDYAVEQ